MKVGIPPKEEEQDHAQRCKGGAYALEDYSTESHVILIVVERSRCEPASCEPRGDLEQRNGRRP